MAEWSNAHDSKSCYGQLYGGSNPSLCAKPVLEIKSFNTGFYLEFMFICGFHVVYFHSGELYYFLLK